MFVHFYRYYFDSDASGFPDYYYAALSGIVDIAFIVRLFAFVSSLSPNLVEYNLTLS